MHRRLYRRTGVSAGITVAAVGLVAVAACSSNSTSSTANTNQHTTISVDCAPPSSNPTGYKDWNADVATFEKANPNITVDSIYASQCIVTAQFDSWMSSGTEPDVYGVYFGNLNQVLDAGQAANITPYIKAGDVPSWNSIVPSSKAPVTAGSTIYGIPYENYIQGLVYNRKLFTEAGLNPNHPPTTWAQVEADATAITKLGHGIWGYGDYSAGGNGGWHFSSEIDANGGSITNSAATAATFNDTAGLQVLQALHTLRFTDKAMSPTQGLAWGTLQKQFAAGKLGMYIAAPDDLYQVIVPQDGGDLNDIGMAPLPSTSGTPAGTLSGGNFYAFNPKDTPAQIEAGLKWINFQNLTLGQGYYNYARQKSQAAQTGEPVGFPGEPAMFQGSMGTQFDALRDKYSTISQSYYSSFANTPETPDGQPADAQALYVAMDPMMLSVLTDPTANIPALLASTEKSVNTILSDANGG